MQDDAAEHCARLARAADRDRFLAGLYAPPRKRRRLFALYAFDAEIARVPHAVREPMAGEIRLQWWRDVIGGERAGEAAANPVSAALLEAVAEGGLPRRPLLDLIEARGFDLYDDPMASLAALEGYADKTAGTMLRLAVQTLSGEAPDALIRHAALAQTVLRIVQALPREAARGRLHLPLDLMNDFGADPADLLAGRVTPELQAVLANLHLRAREALDAARALLPDMPTAALPALLPLAPARALLMRMERAQDPLHPPDLPQWRRQWLIWRAARDPSRLF